MNLSGDFVLQRTTHTVPEKVAKIISCDKIHINNLSSEFTRMTFRVYHGLNDMIMKEYYLIVTAADIALVDLNPSIDSSAECFMVSTNNTVDIYFKPSLTYARTVIQVTYTPQSKAFFKFYDYADFDYNVSEIGDITYATNHKEKPKDVSITYTNNWEDYSTIDATQIKCINNMVTLTLSAKSGTITDGTVVFTINDSDYIPPVSKSIPLTSWDGTNYAMTGIALLTKNGELTLYGVTTNKRILGNITYFI